MESISAEQQHLLKEFRARLQDVVETETDDHYLCRWLKARRYNIDKAEQMYRAHLNFRKKMDVDNLKKNFKIPEVLDKYFSSGGFCGEDREGSPAIKGQLLPHAGVLPNCKCPVKQRVPEMSLVDFLCEMDAEWEEFY